MVKGCKFISIQMIWILYKICLNTVYWNIKNANPSMIVTRIAYTACNATSLLPRRNVPPPPRRYDPPPGGIEVPDDEPIQ